MQHIKKTQLTFLVFFFMGIGTAHGFTFNFGDDDDYPYWGYPNWGSIYNPGYAPPANYYYRRPSSYDRSNMVRKRQRMMDTHDETMDQLSELLYGRYGFDRAQAIKLTRKIEAASSYALTDNFHPSTVTTSRSRTTPFLWGNEQTFKANAHALQSAARALAKELEKQPTAEEGAIYLPKRSRSFDRLKEPETVPVSAGIWEKFNTVSNVCSSCHRSFRRSSW